MFKVDNLKNELENTTVCIDNKWVVAKPEPQLLKSRFKDAIKVLMGKAEAIEFYKQ